MLICRRYIVTLIGNISATASILQYHHFHTSSLITTHFPNMKLQLTDTIDHDEKSKDDNESTVSKTYAMIKPDAIHRAGEIIQRIEREKFMITKAKKIHLTLSDAEGFYCEHKEKSFFGELMEFVTSGPVLSLELTATDCVTKWRALLGPTNSFKAKAEVPNSLRAIFGTDGQCNACHGADSDTSANRELGYFFGSASPKVNASLMNCTLCIIKPQAVASGMVGLTMSAITEAGFHINTLQMIQLKKVQAEQFLECYPNGDMDILEQLLGGLSVVMEIKKDENVATSFKEFLTSFNTELARDLSTFSLNNKLDIDQMKNLIHCTNDSHQAVAEVEYFFQKFTL